MDRHFGLDMNKWKIRLEHAIKPNESNYKQILTLNTTIVHIQIASMQSLFWRRLQLWNVVDYIKRLKEKKNIYRMYKYNEL